MSLVEVRERCRDSPRRARSLLTVRAAISSARSSGAPCSRWLFLMCSYWRARFVPFLTPRGGIALSDYPLHMRQNGYCTPMAKCEMCGNEYDKAFEVVHHDGTK